MRTARTIQPLGNLRLRSADRQFNPSKDFPLEPDCNLIAIASPVGRLEIENLLVDMPG